MHVCEAAVEAGNHTTPVFSTVQPLADIAHRHEILRSGVHSIDSIEMRKGREQTLESTIVQRVFVVEFGKVIKLAACALDSHVSFQRIDNTEGAHVRFFGTAPGYWKTLFVVKPIQVMTCKVQRQARGPALAHPKIKQPGRVGRVRALLPRLHRPAGAPVPR